MGKSKQRIIAKAKNDKNQLQITRTQAIEMAYAKLSKNPSSTDAKKLISLFGLSAEELSEKGLTYEVLRALDGII